MLENALTHNDLVSRFTALLETGYLPGYELAEIFSGAYDQPIQMVVRKLETGRVYLLDLNRDATIDTSSLPA